MSKTQKTMLCAAPLAFYLIWLTVDCQNYPLTYKTNNPTAVTTQTQTITNSSQTDVLLVVDNSASMTENQQRVIDSANVFIEYLANSSNQYHLGILSTDLYAKTDAGRLRMSDPNLPHYFTSPDPNDTQAPAKRQAIISAFQATIQSLGIKGSGNETALGTAITALAPTDPNVVLYNQGFLRPEADLALLVISDEDDCAPNSPNNNQFFATTNNQPWVCYTDLDKLYDMNQLITAFTQIKNGDISKFRAGMIVGGLHQTDGSFLPRGCFINDQNQASTDCGCWSRVESPNQIQDANQIPLFNSFCTIPNTKYNQSCTAYDEKCFLEGDCSSYSNGVCDTPMCITTPATRYTQFLNQLAQTRQAAGLVSGTYSDTICQNDFHQTLLQAASSVIVSNCFTLQNAPTDITNVTMTLSHQRADGSVTVPQTLPRYDPDDPTAECQNCSNCPQGAWQFTAPNTACLACGLQKNAGDVFQISQLQ